MPPEIAGAVEELIKASEGTGYEVKTSSNPMVVYVRPVGTSNPLGEPIYLGHNGRGWYAWYWRTGTPIAAADRPTAVLARVDYLFGHARVAQ